VKTLIKVGKYIWGAGWDKIISIWNKKYILQSQSLFSPHNDVLRAMCDLGDKVLSGSFDGILAMWVLTKSGTK